ncbi:hypothetical protein D3C81_1486120 [compost metagenome]
MAGVTDDNLRLCLALQQKRRDPDSQQPDRNQRPGFGEKAHTQTNRQWRADDVGEFGQYGVQRERRVQLRLAPEQLRPSRADHRWHARHRPRQCCQNKQQAGRCAPINSDDQGQQHGNAERRDDR